MLPRRLRFWLAVIVFIAAVAILLAALLPAPRIQQVLPVPPVVLPTPESTPTGGVLFLMLVWVLYRGGG